MPMFTVLRRFAVLITMLLERILLHVTPSTTVQVIILREMCVPSDMQGHIPSQRQRGLAAFFTRVLPIQSGRVSRSVRHLIHVIDVYVCIHLLPMWSASGERGPDDWRQHPRCGQ